MLRYEPEFIERDGQSLFLLLRKPRDAVKATVVVAPAFAEEMNRCRRMLSELAGSLALVGAELVVVDLHGTGDSDGDFRDARWDTWIDDLVATVAWAASRSSAPIYLLGIRTGALLAAQAADRDPRVAGLILWNPVTKGDTYAKQFLRLKLAADMMARQGVSTKEVRDALMQTGTLEVAGYEFTRELFTALESANLAPPKRKMPIAWFELVSPDSEATLSHAGQAVTQTWAASGIDVRATAIAGEKFWATQEITTCPALAAATANTLAVSGA